MTRLKRSFDEAQDAGHQNSNAVKDLVDRGFPVHEGGSGDHQLPCVSVHLLSSSVKETQRHQIHMQAMEVHAAVWE